MREWGAQPLFAGMPRGVADAGATRTAVRNTRAGPGGGAARARHGRHAAALGPARRARDARSTLVVGERDAKFRAIAERMAAALPTARLLVVAGAGHAAHLEAPDAIVELLGP